MTGPRQTLQTMVRVGLVGGSPYHRDLIHGWLTDTPCVWTITPLPNRRPTPATNGNGNGPAGRAGRAGPDIDLVLGIINGPGDPTLDTCRHLTHTGRTLPLVTLLLTPARQVLKATLDTGAAGLVAATSGSTALARAITAVANGAAWLDPALSHIAMAMARPAHDNGFGLTPTEQRVAAHFPAGLSNREIADQLDISTETVKTHIANIYRKLNATNRTEATTLLQGRSSSGATADPGPGGVDTRRPLT